MQDSAGRKMIAELPSSVCLPTSSRWEAAIAAARASFTHTYTPTTSWHYVRRTVTLKGLALFDPPPRPDRRRRQRHRAAPGHRRHIPLIRPGDRYSRSTGA